MSDQQRWKWIASLVSLGTLLLTTTEFPRARTAGNPLDPVVEITPSQILVWRFFPRTPCQIGSDNPTCPAGDGIPSIINGFCKDQSVCNPLSAAEKLPKDKKIVATHF